MSARRSRGSQHLSPPQKQQNELQINEISVGKSLDFNEMEETSQSSKTKDGYKEKHKEHFTYITPSLSLSTRA